MRRWLCKVGIHAFVTQMWFGGCGRVCVDCGKKKP